MMYLGDQAVGLLSNNHFTHLASHTFINALNEDKWTLPIDESWGQYDFLIVVPNIIVTAQSGQTAGNWLWAKLSNGQYSNETWDADGNIGPRHFESACLLTKGWKSDRFYWYMRFNAGGRGPVIQCITETGATEKISDLTIQYGPLYNGTYGVMNGTVDVYGGCFYKEVTPNA